MTPLHLAAQSDSEKLYKKWGEEAAAMVLEYFENTKLIDSVFDEEDLGYEKEYSVSSDPFNTKLYMTHYIYDSGDEHHEDYTIIISSNWDLKTIISFSPTQYGISMNTMFSHTNISKKNLKKAKKDFSKDVFNELGYGDSKRIIEYALYVMDKPREKRCNNLSKTVEAAKSRIVSGDAMLGDIHIIIGYDICKLFSDRKDLFFKGIMVD